MFDLREKVGRIHQDTLKCQFVWIGLILITLTPPFFILSRFFERVFELSLVVEIILETSERF